MERNFLNIVKNIYENPKANILNGKVWNISLRSGTRQRCPLSPRPPNPVLEVLAGAVQQEKKKKKHPNREGRKTIFIFNDPIQGKPQRTHKKVTRGNKFREVAGQISAQQPVTNDRRRSGEQLDQGGRLVHQKVQNTAERS